jgi:hypothetical protein
MTSQRSHTITGVAAATGEMLGLVRVPTRLIANSRRASGYGCSSTVPG